MSSYRPLIALYTIYGTTEIVHVDRIIKVTQVEISNKTCWKVRIEGEYSDIHAAPSEYSKLLSFCGGQ
jgi:hypothetical protein